jgi:hypothetical protein
MGGIRAGPVLQRKAKHNVRYSTTGKTLKRL